MFFYDDGFVDRSDFFDIIGTYYHYEDIKEITYYKTQENGFKEIINEGTYVIELEDKSLDLYYYYQDQEELEKSLINKIEKYGVKIVYKELLPYK